MIPSRNVWHPLGRNRPPRPVEPDVTAEQLTSIDLPGAVEPDDILAPVDAPEPDEEQLDDAAFLKSLRDEVDGIHAGTVQPYQEKPLIKDRPWGRRHKRRDRYGRAF